MSNDTEFGIDPELADLLKGWETQTAPANFDTQEKVVFLNKNGNYTLKLVIPEGRTLKNFFEPFETVFVKDGVAQNTQQVAIINAIILHADVVGDAALSEKLIDKTAVRHIRLTQAFLREFYPSIQATSAVDDGVVHCALFDVDVSPILDIKIFTKPNKYPGYTIVVNNRKKYETKKLGPAVYPSNSIEEAVQAVLDIGKEKDTLPFAADKAAPDSDW